MSSNLKLKLAVAIGAIVFGGSALSAQTVIIKSSGPSAKTYFPGKQLGANAKIALQSGDIVTVVQSGGTRVFKGPGSFATNGKTATAGLVGSVLSTSGGKQVRTGAVRGGIQMARPSSIWMVDTSKSGKICYTATDKISMWSPRRETPSSLTLKRIADGKTVPMELRPGQMFAAWPIGELPLTDGTQFEITRTGAAPVTLQFKAVASDPATPERTVAAMVQAGCNDQLDILVETTSVNPDEEGEPIG